MSVEEETPREQRIAQNELLFRAVNERIEELGEQWHHQFMDAVCECGDSECFGRVEMSAEEYRRLRGDERHFAVLPGHEIPDVETVVERREGYLVVEKPADAKKIAAD
jgi:hypothetical protein